MADKKTQYFINRKNLSWKQNKLAWLEAWYGDYAKAWKGIPDDRGMMSNIYYHLKEAIETLDEEPHIFIQCAVNDRDRGEVEIMDSIINHFKEKEDA